MNTHTITDPESLKVIWKNHRSKQIRLDVLSNAHCPTKLVIRALSLYNAKEVLELQAIFAKYYLLTEIKTPYEIFLKDCIDLVIFNKTPSKNPIGLKYKISELRNLSLYIQAQCLDGNFDLRLSCLTKITSKAYLSKFLKTSPQFILDLVNTNSGLYSDRLGTLFFLYGYGLIPQSEFILHVQTFKKYLSQPSRSTNLVNCRTVYNVIERGCSGVELKLLEHILRHPMYLYDLLSARMQVRA
jgi:hypothetical protein